MLAYDAFVTESVSTSLVSGPVQDLLVQISTYVYSSASIVLYLVPTVLEMYITVMYY